MGYSNQEIVAHIDHTLLKQTATWEQIQEICREGLQAGVASVCIPPSFVKQAAAYLEGKLSVCTVIGFPNGYQSTATKVFETQEAILNGADEIDMVINIGWVKEGAWKDVEEEIKRIREVSQGRILKVIIETCYLTEEEKIELCHIVTRQKADYIKTSTGFGAAGATLADVRLFGQHIGENVKIKAAGGIRTVEEGVAFLEAGVSRIGASALVKLLQ